ncbi:transcription initiation factor TFIID subunit 11 [Monosporozyma unispora]
MSDAPQGPLDTIPKVNYPPILTPENYYSIKQMIDQIISEDQDYVSWKIKDLRTGGTMNTFVPSDIEHYEPLRENYNQETQENHKQINEVPKNITFVRDIYEAQRSQEVDEMQPLEDLSYEDQFKLLVLNLDEEQNNRFEVFHRTALSKTQVKRLAGVVCSQNVGENVRVFLQAIGKVFAGELIELAMEVRKKWFVSFMICQFDKRKEIGHRLKKYLKKLTILVEKASFDKNSSDPNYLTIIEQDRQDDIIENESDEYFDDEEDAMKEVKNGNKLLKRTDNTSEVKVGLIDQYNKLVKKFNATDVSVERYSNSPILPEHMREAWRLYQLQSDTYIPGQWRSKGEANGDLFR